MLVLVLVSCSWCATSVGGLLAIGNGAIDYAIQEPSYAEYAYYHGLIPLQARQRLEQEWSRYLDALQGGGGSGPGHAVTVWDFDKCDLMGKVSLFPRRADDSCLSGPGVFLCCVIA